MTSLVKAIAATAVLALLALLPAPARAQCTLWFLTGATFSGYVPGSYTASSSPTTISATQTTNGVKFAGANTTCTAVAFSYTGPAPVLSNGSSQIPFTLSASPGGSSLLFPSGGSPASTYPASVTSMAVGRR